MRVLYADWVEVYATWTASAGLRGQGQANVNHRRVIGSVDSQAWCRRWTPMLLGNSAGAAAFPDHATSG